MKYLINRLYGITQQGEITLNNGVKSIEPDCRWLNNVWNRTGGWGITENDSVESDFREK